MRLTEPVQLTARRRRPASMRSDSAATAITAGSDACG